MEEDGPPVLRARQNPLMKKIEMCIRKTGYDENFIRACQFHLDKICPSQFENSDKSMTEYCHLLLSNLFMAKMEMYPTRKFKCQINENSAWPLMVQPSEIFTETEIPAATRKKSFYGCLRVGDYLECRVTANLPTEYHLRVIHKYGVARILDDLKIIVVLPKTETELNPLQKEFEKCELIRVLVNEKINDGDETKVLVTVNDKRKELMQLRPPLGLIPQNCLPGYVLDPFHFDGLSSFKDYLNCQRGFFNPILLNIYEGFGIDPRGYYSYFPCDKSLSSIDANALLREAKLSEVEGYTTIALRDLKNEAYSYALNSIDIAIKMYPKDVNEKEKAELYKLYEIRGRIHAENEKPKMSINGLKDWILAYSNDAVKVHLSKAIFIGTNYLYRNKEYRTAAEWVEKAVMLNENNVEARALLDYLKKTHPEAFENLDEESLLALQEKKKDIVTQLKKYRVEMDKNEKCKKSLD